MLALRAFIRLLSTFRRGEGGGRCGAGRRTQRSLSQWVGGSGAGKCTRSTRFRIRARFRLKISKLFQNSTLYSDIMMLAVSKQAEYFVLHVEFCYLCYLLIELVDSMHQSNMIWHRMWLWSHRLKNLWVKAYIMSVSSDFKIEKQQQQQQQP